MSTARTAPASGAVLFVSAWASTLLQLVVVGVLARALPPAVFGSFAIALVLLRLLTIVGQLGVGAALVQLRTLESSHARVAMTVALAGSCAIVLVVALLAPHLDAALRVEGAAAALEGMALALPLAALGAVAIGLLEREQRFSRLAVIEPLSYLIGFAPLAIALARAGHGVMALAAAHVGRTAVASAIAFALRPHAVVPTRDRAAWRALLSVGIGLMLSRLAASVSRELDVFVVGRVLGASSLGCYSRATRMTTIPVNTSAAVLGRLVFTRLARLQDDAAARLDGYRGALALAMLLTAPFAAVVAVLADDVVLLLLGARFAEAAPVTRVLAIITPLVAAHQVSVALLHATGRGGASAARSLLHGILIVVGTIALVAQGLSIVGAALALCIAETARTLATIPRCARACDAPTRAILPAFGPALLVGMLTAAVAFASRTALLWLGVSSASHAGGAAAVVLVSGGVACVVVAVACVVAPRVVVGPHASGAALAAWASAPAWTRVAWLEARLLAASARS